MSPKFKNSPLMFKRNKAMKKCESYLIFITIPLIIIGFTVILPGIISSFFGNYDYMFLLDYSYIGLIILAIYTLVFGILTIVTLIKNPSSKILHQAYVDLDYYDIVQLNKNTKLYFLEINTEIFGKCVSIEADKTDSIVNESYHIFENLYIRLKYIDGYPQHFEKVSQNLKIFTSVNEAKKWIEEIQPKINEYQQGLKSKEISS